MKTNEYKTILLDLDGTLFSYDNTWTNHIV